MADSMQELFDVTIGIAAANGRFAVGCIVRNGEPRVRECATFAEAQLFVAEICEQLAVTLRKQAVTH